MAKRGEKNPCLWIGVRKYIAPNYMQTNQYHYQKRSVRPSPYRIVLNRCLSCSVCVFVCVFVDTFILQHRFSVAFPTRNAFDSRTISDFYVDFFCTLFFPLLFFLFSSFFLCMLGSLPVAE